MSTCANINDFKECLLAVFVNAYSEYTGKNTDGDDNICAEKQNYLLEKIKTFVFVENNDYIDREYDYLEYLDDDVDSTDIISFIEGVREEAEKLAKSVEDTDNLNAFYCPEIVNHLVKLAKHFPIWTNVMLHYFPSEFVVATSAGCEGYFKDLKCSDLGSDYQPMRADKFIVKHIKSIESISKLECFSNKKLREIAAMNQSKNVNKKHELDTAVDAINNGNIDDVEYLQCEENWYGRNKDIKYTNNVIDEIDKK